MNTELCCVSGGKLPQSWYHITFTFSPSALYETRNEDKKKMCHSCLFIHDVNLQFVHVQIDFIHTISLLDQNLSCVKEEN